MKRSSFAELFYKNAGYVSVFLISLIYIASSLLLISKTGKSIYEIIGTGVIGMLVGSMINGVFRSSGIKRGEEDEKYISTTNLYARVLEEITPYLDKLEEFCALESASAEKALRRRMLSEAGIRYDDFFDKSGILISTRYELYSNDEIEKMSKRDKRRARRKNSERARALRRAQRVRVKQLTPAILTSDADGREETFDFGRTKRGYTSRKSASDILSRIAMAIIFGCFGVSLSSEINPATIIWNTLQIVMYLTSGAITMHSAYIWISDEYRQSIIKKIDILERFKLYVQKL